MATGLLRGQRNQPIERAKYDHASAYSIGQLDNLGLPAWKVPYEYMSPPWLNPHSLPGVPSTLPLFTLYLARAAARAAPAHLMCTQV